MASFEASSMVLGIGSRIKTLGSFPIKRSQEDVARANWLLREGIRELKNLGRDKKARLSEVLCYIETLEKGGFLWQSSRLQNWLYFYWQNLRPERSISERSEEVSF